MQKFALLLILVFVIPFLPYSSSEGIPDWVKNTAGWWSERQISQSEFTDGLEFLINESIIYIPETEPVSPGPDKIIPDWVRNTAGWWSKNLIPDSEFTSAMKYLIQIGIIEVKVSSPILVEEEISEESITTSTKIGKPLHMLLEGYPGVEAEAKFALDAKIFDAEKYSGNKFTNREYTLDGVKINFYLYNEENKLIHTHNGITKNGIVRYDVMAKETSMSNVYWLYQNEYTVKVVATLDDQTVEKNHTFFGRANSAYYGAESSSATNSVEFNVDNASYLQTKDINSPVTTPEGLIFSADGTKMFIADNQSKKIEEFSLTTAWDISTASDNESEYTISDGGSNDIEDIAFNHDGSKMFVVERADDKILEYRLGSPYDVSAAVDLNDDLDITDDTENPEDIAFNSDGTIMFILENHNDDSVLQYGLTTAYDVSTAALSKSFDLTGSGATNADAFEFNSDGTIMFVANPNSDDKILQFKLNTSWDVSTAFLDKTLDISDKVSASRGLAFGDEGTRMYIVSANADNSDDFVYEYILS